jgi:hypothetical protein
MIKHPLAVLGGLLAGIALMAYLDSRGGGHGRSLLRGKFARGVFAARHPSDVPQRPADGMRQLHERIRAHLGHVVSHPRSVRVEIEGDAVCLRGHVLRSELDGLIEEVRRIAGTKAVRDELQPHDSPAGLPELQGRSGAPPRVQRTPGTTWH